MFPWEYGLWLRRAKVLANCPCNQFPRFPISIILIHQRHRRTGGQTDRQTDRQTDDVQTTCNSNTASCTILAQVLWVTEFRIRSDTYRPSWMILSAIDGELRIRRQILWVSVRCSFDLRYRTERDDDEGTELSQRSNSCCRTSEQNVHRFVLQQPMETPNLLLKFHCCLQ